MSKYFLILKPLIVLVDNRVKQSESWLRNEKSWVTFNCHCSDLHRVTFNLYTLRSGRTRPVVSRSSFGANMI